MNSSVNTLVSSGKNFQIQAVRGICMVCVCFIHIISSFDELNPYFTITARTVVNFCTGLFFFISAYLVNVDKVKKQTKKYLTKRIIHLYVPFIFYSIGYTVFNRHLYFASIKEVAVTIARILIGSNAPQLYFIIILIIFTVFCPLLIKSVESKYKILNLIILSISPIYLIALFLKEIDVNVFFINDYLPSIIVRVLPFGYLICYYLGLYFKINGFPKFNSMFLIPITFFIALTVNIIEYNFLGFPLNEVCGQIKLVNIIFIVSIMINFDKILIRIRIFNTKLLEKIADFSFGIYFIHEFIVIMLFKILQTFNINYCSNIFVSIIFLIVMNTITVFVSWFIIFALKKIVKPKPLKTLLCVQ